jgi:ferric-dicitrate binding protein FerR (iron transport regulator)
MSQEGKDVRRVLREAPPPRADATFRERLKADFTSGRIAEHEPRGSRPWYARAARPAALAAAAALVLTLAGLLNRGPAWEVTGSSGEGSVQVDGVPVPLSDLDAIRKRTRPGAEVQVPAGGEVTITAAGTLAILLTGGTEMTVPPRAGRWLGRDAEIYVRAGEIRITTGPGFAGARLTVHTPDALARVTGTTLAVIVAPEGTCVCVLEGTAELGPSEASLSPVPAGMRLQLYRDGTPPLLEPIRDMERMKLDMFLEFARPRLTSVGR